MAYLRVLQRELILTLKFGTFDTFRRSEEDRCRRQQGEKEQHADQLQGSKKSSAQIQCNREQSEVEATCFQANSQFFPPKRSFRFTIRSDPIRPMSEIRNPLLAIFDFRFWQGKEFFDWFITVLLYNTANHT